MMEMNAKPPVRLESADGVARIVLARGDHGNAFDLEFANTLRDAALRAADLVRDDTVSVVLLRAEGRNFSVGGDLRTFLAQGENVASYTRALADAAHGAVLALAGLPVPVVAEVQGAVAGAGVGLALSTDLVVAARSARLRLAYTAVGLTPDCGASWFLPRLLGGQRTLDLLLTNRVLGSAEAERWGLVSRVVDDEDLPSAAEELVRSLASGHGRALGRAKLLARTERLDELRDHLDREAELIAEAVARPEAMSAIARLLRH